MNNALTPNSTFTQWILNDVYNSATAAFIDIYENTYCNGILIVKNELTLNSKLNQKILNLLYDSATAAYICTFMGTPEQFGIDSATASYIYVYGNSFCNGTLTVNNAPPPNSTLTQSILNLVDDSASAEHMYINGTSISMEP